MTTRPKRAYVRVRPHKGQPLPELCDARNAWIARAYVQGQSIHAILAELSTTQWARTIPVETTRRVYQILHERGVKIRAQEPAHARAVARAAALLVRGERLPSSSDLQKLTHERDGWPTWPMLQRTFRYYHDFVEAAEAVASRYSPAQRAFIQARSTRKP